MLIQSTEIISIHAGIRAGKKYRFPNILLFLICMSIWNKRSMPMRILPLLSQLIFTESFFRQIPWKAISRSLCSKVTDWSSIYFFVLNFSLSDSHFSFESLTPKDISFLMEESAQSACFIRRAFSFEMPSFLTGMEVQGAHKIILHSSRYPLQFKTVIIDDIDDKGRDRRLYFKFILRKVLLCYNFGSFYKSMLIQSS